MTDSDDRVNQDGLIQAEESELIARTRAGDDEAYAALVRRYQARLRGYASRYVDNSPDVFELVQDAFLNAYRNLERFDAAREFYPWLRAICRNLVLNYFRSRKSRRNINLQLVDYAICERIADDDGTADRGDGQRIDALRKCIAALSPAQQKLIRTRYHGEVPVKDIAEELEVSPTGVSMRLGRIREKLRKCLSHRLELQTS